jgi:hypothetical protein
VIAFGGNFERVHIMVGSQFVQVLENPSPGAGDDFGEALAMNRYADGTIDLWVGAPGSDTSSGVDSGSITLFRRARGSSQFVLVGADFTPPGTEQGERLGAHLSMRGSTLVVASPDRAPTETAGRGMARVLKRSARGVWSVVAGSVRSAPGSDCAVNVATNGTLVAVAIAGRGEIARVVRVVNGRLRFVRSFDRPALFNGKNFSPSGTGLALSSGASPVLLVTDADQTNGDRRVAGAVYPFTNIMRR